MNSMENMDTDVRGVKKTSAEGQTLNDLIQLNSSTIQLFKSVQILKLASKLGVLLTACVLFSIPVIYYNYTPSTFHFVIVGR